MSKHVLLTASEHNGGVIPFGMGRWLSTTWKIYSDGTYEKSEEFDEMKFCFEGKPQPRHTSTTRGAIGESLMTNLKECLSSHSCFPKRGLGCDMNWWEISIFDSNQQVLDRYRGVVSPKETDGTLKTICEVLPTQRSAVLRRKEEMKVCPNCNNTVEDNAIFCDKCGARLPESGSICRKCGTKLPDGSRFCSKCGTPQSTAGAFSGIHAQRLSNPGVHSSNRIFIFILCVVLLLSILILPMFTLKSGYITNKGEFRSQQKYSISLLGENYMPDSEYRDTVNTLSRLAFIFMLAAIIAVVFFLLTNKKWHCLLAAVLNFGILLFYEISVSVTWAAVERYPDKTVAVPGVGSWLCILSAIALIIIVFAEFRNVDVRKMDWKSENQKVSRRIYRPENTIYFVCLFSIGIQK